MKVIFCLCLVAPLVFGSVIPAESDDDIEAYDLLDDNIKAPTEEQMKCVHDAIKNVKEANKDLDWWFDDLKKLSENIQSKYEKCKSIDKEPEKKKCLRKLKLYAAVELRKIVKSLPEENKQVWCQLKDEIKKCFKSA